MLAAPCSSLVQSEKDTSNPVARIVRNELRKLHHTRRRRFFGGH